MTVKIGWGWGFGKGGSGGAFQRPSAPGVHGLHLGFSWGNSGFSWGEKNGWGNFFFLVLMENDPAGIIERYLWYFRSPLREPAQAKRNKAPAY